MKWLMATVLTTVVGAGMYFVMTRPTPCEELQQICKEGNQALDVRVMGLCSFGWLAMGHRNQLECDHMVNVIKGEGDE